MAERVVNVFKIIDINEQYRDAGMIPLGNGNRMRNSIIQQDAIRKVGQEIVQG